jgi:catechol 2,3-dioxygenase-like lactoylglutathione lyase family enzyme
VKAPGARDHAPAMPITEMNHFTVLARDLDETRTFYVEMLGLSEGPRPPLGFPGAWLYAGGHPVLHVIGGRALPEDPKGVLDHMAFSATALGDITRRLAAANVPYDLRRQPASGVWQLFFFDPNGARVELDFDPSEPKPTDAT